MIAWRLHEESILSIGIYHSGRLQVEGFAVQNYFSMLGLAWIWLRLISSNVFEGSTVLQDLSHANASLQSELRGRCMYMYDAAAAAAVPCHGL